MDQEDKKEDDEVEDDDKEDNDEKENYKEDDDSFVVGLIRNQQEAVLFYICTYHSNPGHYLICSVITSVSVIYFGRPF